MEKEKQDFYRYVVSDLFERIFLNDPYWTLLSEDDEVTFTHNSGYMSITVNIETRKAYAKASGRHYIARVISLEELINEEIKNFH